MEGCQNNVGLITKQGPVTQNKNIDKVFKKNEFPNEAKEIFGLKEKQDEKK